MTKVTEAGDAGRDTRGLGSRAASGTVGVKRVDAEVLAKSSLSRIDYVDHFMIPHQVKGHATPEQWARAMFGDAPDPTERLLWSGILGLRLSREASAETIAGWKITGQGEGWVRTFAASWNANAELIIHASHEMVGLATVVRYMRKPAPFLWVPVSFVHRRLVPVLLRSTVRSMRGKIC